MSVFPFFPACTFTRERKSIRVWEARPGAVSIPEDITMLVTYYRAPARRFQWCIPDRQQGKSGHCGGDQQVTATSPQHKRNHLGRTHPSWTWESWNQQEISSWEKVEMGCEKQSKSTSMFSPMTEIRNLYLADILSIAEGSSLQGRWKDPLWKTQEEKMLPTWIESNMNKNNNNKNINWHLPNTYRFQMFC